MKKRINKKKAGEFFYEGFNLMFKDKYKKAMTFFDRCIQYDDTNAAPFFYKGICILFMNQKKKNLEESERCLKIAFKLNKDSTIIWYRLSELQRILGKRKDAEKSRKKRDMIAEKMRRGSKKSEKKTKKKKKQR